MADPEDALDPLEALRARVIKLGSDTLTQLERDLTRGSVNQRNAAIRLVAPYLLKALDATDTDDSREQMKQAVEDLMAEMAADDGPESDPDEPPSPAEPPQDSRP